MRMLIASVPVCLNVRRSPKETTKGIFGLRNASRKGWAVKKIASANGTLLEISFLKSPNNIYCSLYLFEEGEKNV